VQAFGNLDKLNSFPVSPVIGIGASSRGSLTSLVRSSAGIAFAIFSIVIACLFLVCIILLHSNFV
jgi:hypothetical protein